MFNHYHKKQARIQGGVQEVERNPEILARECGFILENRAISGQILSKN